MNIIPNSPINELYKEYEEYCKKYADLLSRDKGDVLIGERLCQKVKKQLDDKLKRDNVIYDSQIKDK